MGILVERTIRRKNEMVYFPHIGQEFRQGLTQVSQYATLTGLEGLRRGRYMEVKPFAIAGRSEIGARGAAEGETETLNDLGLDFKYSITSNLTLDATVNPDFAQVEADNVQINLTRFSLFFPEKREFFLERAGLFDFGDAEETQVFFSRRIGITNDIVGGGRLTGQAGPVSVGALSLYTDDAAGPRGGTIPGGLNSVLRLRADPFPRTTVGGIVTSLDTKDGANRVAGGDVQVRFGGSSFVQGWVARSSSTVDASASSPGSSATALSVVGDLRNSLVSVGAGYARIPEAFDPALGFVRRRDMRRAGGSVAVFPRFETSRWARQLLAVLYGAHIAGLDGVKQSTVLYSRNMLTFQTGDRAVLTLRRRSEALQAPVRIQGRELAAGDYAFQPGRAAPQHERQPPFLGTGRVLGGTVLGRHAHRAVGWVDVEDRTVPHDQRRLHLERSQPSRRRRRLHHAPLRRHGSGRGEPLTLRQRPRPVRRRLQRGAGQRAHQLDPHAGERPLRGVRHGVSAGRPAGPADRALAAPDGGGEGDVPEGVLRVHRTSRGCRPGVFSCFFRQEPSACSPVRSVQGIPWVTRGRPCEPGHRVGAKGRTACLSEATRDLRSRVVEHASSRSSWRPAPLAPCLHGRFRFNRTPEPAAGLSQALPDVSVNAGTSDTVDVWEYFIDPRRRRVSFTAESSNTGVATVAVYGSSVVVHGVAQGRVTITVTATDDEGLAASANFEAEVKGFDWNILVELYESTGGSMWRYQFNWLTDEPLDTWYGVRVDLGARVVALSLANNRLQGSLPPSLGELAGLYWLSLPGNELSGPIPSALFGLSGLSNLDLADNEFVGTISEQIADLSNLNSLNLSANRLTGRIPPELGEMTELSGLGLWDNELSGPIPAALANLSGLTTLYLGGNRLSGPIPPELGSLAGLLWLSLRDNRLSGPIPAALAEARQLRELDLSGNELTGSIPAEFGELRGLSLLALSGNTLSGPIPGELGAMRYLNVLDLSDNQLEGSIPAELAALWDLAVLQLSGNSLAGAIPPALGDLRNLEELYLGDNDLTGPLPPELGNLRRLELLDLRGNTRLSGEIPAAWAGLGRLETLATHDTGLCAPADPVVQDWLEGVTNQRLASCGSWDAYLVQTVQSREYPVPLVAGSDCAVACVPDRAAHHGGGSPARASHLLPGWCRVAPGGDPGQVHPGAHRHRRGFAGQVGQRRCSRVGGAAGARDGDRNRPRGDARSLAGRDEADPRERPPAGPGG